MRGGREERRALDARSLTAARLREALTRGDISVEEYYSALYEAIENIEKKVNAFITLRPLEEVVADAERALRTRGPLAGIPVAVKDNISVKGLPATCGSKMLSRYKPPYNATVVERLLEAGAVIIGKTNMDEFAMGSTGETSYYGATRNPWNPSRVPGGSSSGSAAALAAGMAPLALGSDTGGSIRLPAAWTGVYGLKPTYGTVSRHGLIAYAESLEQIGPMARTVEDLALLHSIIAGYDPRDSTSLESQPPATTYIEALSREPEGLRVGVVVDLTENPLVDKRISRLVWRAAELLERRGVEVGEARLGKPVIDYALPAYYIIALAEASSNLARYDGVRYGYGEKPRPWESWNKFYMRIRREGFGREVRKRIMLGSWILSAGYRDQFYINALRVRRLVADSLNKTLKDYDAILMPSAIEPPPRLGEVEDNPEKMYLLDLANVPINLAGLPALALPIDWIDGIPTGIQIVTAPLRDPLLITLAKSIEDETNMRNLIAAT